VAVAVGCSGRSPVIDALIVGMDLLIRKTAGKRYEKRIFLVTDAGCPVNQDDLDVVCEQFLKIDARLNVMYDTALPPPLLPLAVNSSCSCSCSSSHTHGGGKWGGLRGGRRPTGRLAGRQRQGRIQGTFASPP
jgi:hypothetical protein